MTKLEIVKQIARETGIEATTVSAVVEGFMEEVRAAQIRKENVFCAASVTGTITRDWGLPFLRLSGGTMLPG